jgi:hypothetical protein
MSALYLVALCGNHNAGINIDMDIFKFSFSLSWLCKVFVPSLQVKLIELKVN